MLKSFLKIAIRNFTSRKGYAMLNMAGLAIGITCCMLIFEYVAYEKSYDVFNKNADRIVRVQDENFKGRVMVVPCAAAMPGIAPAMKQEFPEVEDICRLVKAELLLANDSRDLKFRELSVYYADSSVQNIFALQLISGNEKTALSGPGKIILSETEAKKYFGNEDPLGKVLTSHGGSKPRPLEVTGVFKDYPLHSHLKLDILVSYPTYSQVTGYYGKANNKVETSFTWTNFYTYALLRKGTDIKQFEAKLPAFIDRHYNSLPASKASGDSFSLSLMPLKRIHLYSHYTQEAEANGDARSVNFLFVIAFFIIVIAWINYVNIATASSLERAREVGVRKVLGAMSGSLMRQFLTESILMNVLALAVALIVTFLVTPLFSQLTDRSLEYFLFLPMRYKEYFLAVLSGGILLSGIYPALVLSRYQPLVVLKGAFKNATSGRLLRKTLIVGQFTASIVLIAGTIIVYRQLQFMKNQDLGADINQTLVLNGAGSGLNDSAYSDAYAAFKQDVLKIGGVSSITASSGIMGREILWSTDWHKLRGGTNAAINLFHLGVDDDFTSAYGLKILAGEPFSKSPVANYRKVILNESAIAALGISSPQAAIGQLITGGQTNMDSMQIAGVIKDYHNEGLQKSIQPLVLLPGRRTRQYYSIKISANDPAVAVNAIKKIWDNHFRADLYQYFFLDEFFNRQYAEDKRFGKVFALFALLAIGIACFGLFGLAAYDVLHRRREIGVRKVLGASVPGLMYTLSRDLLVLVVIAFLIAIPITWITMNDWLQSFAYRTTIAYWIFAVAGMLSIFVAMISIGFHALKAALANPVRSLRTE